MRYLQTKVGRLQTILGNVGGWCYLWSIDVGRADPEKPDGIIGDRFIDPKE